MGWGSVSLSMGHTPAVRFQLQVRRRLRTSRYHHQQQHLIPPIISLCVCFMQPRTLVYLLSAFSVGQLSVIFPVRPYLLGIGDMSNRLSVVGWLAGWLVGILFAFLKFIIRTLKKKLRKAAHIDKNKKYAQDRLTT